MTCDAREWGSPWAQLIDWSNLLSAWKAAARGKRGLRSAAGFEDRGADRLLDLQQRLADGSYAPAGYTHFYIHEPKKRRISAAKFPDRVVHHALCKVIEPDFERRFIPESFANRKAKGSHRAIDHVQREAQRFRYALSLDVVRHFPSIDHAILLRMLAKVVRDERVFALCETIVRSGQGVLDQEYRMVYFPGDDLFAMNRPRGLPIGNLTSQFWSNCYLHPIDSFIKRSLPGIGYARYVDDMRLFANDKRALWAAKAAVLERLAKLRLVVHESSAQVRPCRGGIPWLGFVVYPGSRRVKARKVRHATRKLDALFMAWQRGETSFAVFDASVQGWINHVRYADSVGLREHVLRPFVWGPRAREVSRIERA